MVSSQVQSLADRVMLLVMRECLAGTKEFWQRCEMCGEKYPGFYIAPSAPNSLKRAHPRATATCSKCRSSQYCSQDCQRRSWVGASRSFLRHGILAQGQSCRVDQNQTDLKGSPGFWFISEGLLCSRSLITSIDAGYQEPECKLVSMGN